LGGAPDRIRVGVNNRGFRSVQSLRRRAAIATILTGTLTFVTMASWTGVAAAASGGGYESSQMDCQPFDSDWATPQNLIYPGCHNMALNVESGGTSQGDAGTNNTRYFEYGGDQMGNDNKSQGTQTEYSIGYPGDTGSPHAGCLSFNTDGTGGGAAPSTQAPEAASKAENTQYGCGNNPNGAGFELDYDYYQWYCPIVAAAGHACEDPSYGKNQLTIDHGMNVADTPIIEHGLLVYFGEDDNNDNTEHDGVGPFTNTYPQDKNDEGAENGASDGGATALSITPLTATNLPTATHPEGFLNFSAGFCADGICAEGTTQQQTVAHGCDAPDSYVAANGTSPSKTSQAPCDKGTPNSADVYNYATQDPSVDTESPNCNSGDVNTNSNAACGPGGENAIRSAEPNNENTEPGIQLYSDPDSSRSPALPSPLWPTPGIYVGSCGLYLGSPALPTASLFNKLPVGNGAGQIAIDPLGC
jgi:hypothetical protein